MRPETGTTDSSNAPDSASTGGGIDGIVFDLGNVLVDWDPRYLYARYFDDPAEMERFLAEVCTMDWHTRHDAGVSFAENRAELVRRYPEHADLIEAFDRRWPEMFRGPIPEAEQILRELAAREHPLFALTNYSDEKWDDLWEIVDFLDLFTDIVVSGREGLVKPDPRIFELMLSRFDLQAERTVFIDDNVRNIDSARALGIRAIQFTDAVTLRHQLARLGLL